ncbi:hypothetical protein I4U23_018101 [Adineta vaga]|nr:hypothetical protein I4U23_018101 [Adineta vaga]
MISWIEFFLILITINSSINSYCLDFENSSAYLNNSCQLIQPTNITENTYRECLQCHLNFIPIELIHQADSCKQHFKCIVLIFYTNIIFENFFQKYLYLVKNLFEYSNHSVTQKSLHIQIEHDNYPELTLRYIQSILHSNGTDYSYLIFTLSDHRKQIQVDFRTNILNTLLTAIQILIVCNNDTTLLFYITSSTPSIFQSNACILSENNHSNTTYRTSTKDFIPKTNLILFLGGLIIFLIWILCICSCLYVKYYKWKTHENVNQRSSIVSSVFSLDSSVDSRNEESLLTQQKRQMGRYGLYSYSNEL